MRYLLLQKIKKCSKIKSVGARKMHKIGKFKEEF